MSATAFMEGRLDKLPRKVAAPIRDMVRNGLMSTRTTETVLEAHDLVGEPQHVLGFAITALEYHLQGVAVRDTIRMAREQGTRINQRWSAKRWTAEHDRLARAATIEKLTTANETYELSKYEEHLPAEWPGYLVRTSRRLGFEGLRQRHCVAAYNRDIKAGQCAIATVFVDKTRWTVELQRTSHAEQPLRITQISGRHNARPTTEQRKTVHERLGLPQESGRRRPGMGQADPDRRYLENLRRLLPTLRDHGVALAHVTFVGEKGTVRTEAVRFNPHIETHGITVPCEITQTEVCERHDLEPGLQEVPVDVALEEITYDHLGETHANWIDRHGGEVTLTVSALEGDVNVLVLVNEMDTNRAFYRTTDIASGAITYEI